MMLLRVEEEVCDEDDDESAPTWIWMHFTSTYIYVPARGNLVK